MDEKTENKLIELLKKRWVSLTEIKSFFNGGSNRCMAWINVMSNHYPLAEDKQGKTPIFKIMNKGDYI